MRRQEKEVADIKEIDKIITNCQVCHIGLCNDNTPYVVPVNFGYDGKYLYFHSASQGRKLDCIKKNNKVCFEMECDSELITSETACKWSSKYKSIIGFGRAEIVTEHDTKISGLKVIMTHYSNDEFSFNEETVKRMAIVRIKIEKISGKKSGY